MRSSRVALLACVLLLLGGLVALSDGIIVPIPPPGEPPGPPTWLSIVYHHVTVRIEGGVVITHVDQEFRNDHPFPVEGTYLFPLPPGAVVQGFTLWVDGRWRGRRSPLTRPGSSTSITCGAIRTRPYWSTWAGTPTGPGCSPSHRERPEG